MLVYKKPESLRKDMKNTFCPGCDHGLALKFVAQMLDDFNLREKTIAIASVGCSVFLYDYLDVDIVESPHGRSLAVATGVKRGNPDKFVLTYQGDGDFASIGLAESLHGAARGENITAICINNTTYGMTGGQAGPTTLINQITTTTPNGRKPELTGYPLKIAEMVALQDGTAFCARVSLDSTKAIFDAQKALKRAFEAQINNEGFSFIEILASCPTNWKMTPQQSHERIREEMYKVFPLGIYKDRRSN